MKINKTRIVIMGIILILFLVVFIIDSPEIEESTKCLPYQIAEFNETTQMYDCKDDQIYMNLKKEEDRQNSYYDEVICYWFGEGNKRAYHCQRAILECDRDLGYTTIIQNETIKGLFNCNELREYFYIDYLPKVHAYIEIVNCKLCEGAYIDGHRRCENSEKTEQVRYMMGFGEMKEWYLDNCMEKKQ